MNRSIRAAILSTSSIAALGLSLAAVSAPAVAQEAGPLTSDRVVVTGSRIARRDFQANSPIVTVDESTFEDRSSFAVEQALNQLPQFTPGQSQNLASGGGTPFPSANNAPGAATLNLRGLDANRNLVLVNGRRPQPVSAQLLVDVNTIPSAAIENVEIITGGAAAVYGADAIAGVVNFILKDNFEGFEIDAQYGVSEQGDNEQSQISVLLGGNFGDGRGNAMVGGSWSQRGVAYQRDREFYTDGWRDPLTTAGSINNATPAITQISGRGIPGTFGVNADGTLFNVSSANNPAAPYKGPLNDGPGGSGYKLNPPNPPTAAFRPLGWNDPDAQLTIPLTRYSAFASGHYDLTDSVETFFDFTYTHTESSAISLIPPAFNFWALTIPYMPANDDPDSPTFGADRTNFHPVSRQLADLLNARPAENYCLFGTAGCPTSRATANPLLVGTPHPNQPWVMTRSLDFLGRLRTDNSSNVMQFTAGLRGELPVRDWTWDFYGSHGETDIVSQQFAGSVSQENLQQMINGRATGFGVGVNGGTVTEGVISATGPWGAGWSNLNTVNPGTCTSGIPIFNANGGVPGQVSVTQDCFDYATLRTNTTTALEQNVVEASMQGGLFDAWAGEIRFALGAQYREASFAFNPDSGITSNQARNNVVNIIAAPVATEGEISVQEVYGELLIPLLSDVPLVQQFDLELGGRLSDYNTAGTLETYKILGDWAVNDWLRFRGGFQLATRAPNLYELFAPRTASGAFSGSNDPCTNIPGFTAPYGNLATNPNRVNVQLACAELIRRDGGFSYTTMATDPNPGQPATAFGTPGLDPTHISNFRWSVIGYNFPFGITLPLEQGNPNLEAEEAETWTLGAVISSPWSHALLDRLTLSIDWYSIDLTGTIERPDAITVYQQCLDPTYNPRIAQGGQTGAQILEGNQYCALINREPIDLAGTPGAVSSGIDRSYDAQYANMGGTQTAGIDVAVNWAADFADMGMGFIPGSVNVNVTASWLDFFREAPFEGAKFIDYTGTYFGAGYYKYKTFTTVTWMMDEYSVGLRARYLPKINPPPGATAGTWQVASHTEFDLFGRWMISDSYEIRAGIDNLLNDEPETVGRTPINNASNSTNGNYDVIGRRFFIGGTARF